MTSRTFFGTQHQAVPHPPHRHDEDQLHWFPDGATTVFVGARRWLLRSTGAFWFPAGTVHAVEPLAPGATHSIYSAAHLRPAGERWDRAGAVSCSPFMAEILRHMSQPAVSPGSRIACRSLLVELLQHSDELPSSLVLPSHPVARRVAEQILAEPADATSLAEHAAAAGISDRTLMRAFSAETGMRFTQWRTQARIIASLSLLSSGMPVSAVGSAIGYRTTSGYIEAFRRLHGTTPAAHARGRAS